MGQLTLSFPHRPDYADADFLEAPSNAEAVAWIARPGDWPDGRLALWGEAGCGKTHLLHRWADATGATWFDGSRVRLLSVLPASGGIAVDSANESDEEGLLHLLNAAKEGGLPVLLAATRPPARWTTRLPDLASRLRAITAIGIGTPDDMLLRALLAKLLAERQLAVPQKVQDWLLTRLPRTPAVIRRLAARLDQEALASRSRVTRPMAARIVTEFETQRLCDSDELCDAEESTASPEPPFLL